MFKKYPINSYLRLSFNDLKDYLSPEFKAHLRVVFQVSDLKDVELQYGSGDDVVIHYKGEK